MEAEVSVSSTRSDVVWSLIYLGETATGGGDPSEASQIFLDALSMSMETRAIPVTQDALVGLAYLQAQAGEIEQVLKLSVCVASHTASPQEAKDRAGPLRVELEVQLTPQQIEMAQANAQTTSFDLLVRELLKGFETPIADMAPFSRTD